MLKKDSDIKVSSSKFGTSALCQNKRYASVVVLKSSLIVNK